jgi:LmbE family N-acetylglucosaminyl deacetylase
LPINNLSVSYTRYIALNILAIGAHPDDIELGCGGLLLKAVKEGHRVFMYTLTRGAASGDPVQRCSEQMEAAKLIGAHAMWIDNFEDTKLSLNVELIQHIEWAVNYAHPDVIYTHPVGDTHHDHRAVAEATLEAARFVPNILSYEMPVTKDFKPHVYYDISDAIDDKIELLNVFISQKHKMFITSHATKGLAQYRALQSRLHPLITAVEAFEVQKLGFGTDFQLLSAHPEESKIAAGYKNPLSQEVLEWRRPAPVENPILNTFER